MELVMDYQLNDLFTAAAGEKRLTADVIASGIRAANQKHCRNF